MTVKSFRDLKIWQEGHALALQVYRVSTRFPREEMYGLTSQLRRAAASVPANLAEGVGRRTTREFINFLCIARGSLQEVDYFLQLAKELGYLDGPNWEPLAKRYRGLDAGMRACLENMSKKTAA